MARTWKKIRRDVFRILHLDLPQRKDTCSNYDDDDDDDDDDNDTAIGHWSAQIGYSIHNLNN